MKNILSFLALCLITVLILPLSVLQQRAWAGTPYPHPPMDTPAPAPAPVPIPAPASTQPIVPPLAPPLPLLSMEAPTQGSTSTQYSSMMNFEDVQNYLDRIERGGNTVVSYEWLPYYPELVALNPGYYNSFGNVKVVVKPNTDSGTDSTGGNAGSGGNPDASGGGGGGNPDFDIEGWKAGQEKIYQAQRESQALMEKYINTELWAGEALQLYDKVGQGAQFLYTALGGNPVASAGLSGARTYVETYNKYIAEGYSKDVAKAYANEQAAVAIAVSLGTTKGFSQSPVGTKWVNDTLNAVADVMTGQIQGIFRDAAAENKVGTSTPVDPGIYTQTVTTTGGHTLYK